MTERVLAPNSRTGFFELRDLPLPLSTEVQRAVAEDDAAWFRANPEATERVRPFRQGEAPAGRPPVGHRWVATVVVRQAGTDRLACRFVSAPREEASR